jgi:hypothetical protein
VTPTDRLLLDLAVTVVAGLAMLRMGLRRNVLSVRSTSHRCASCRRRIETPYCPHCTR